MGLGARRLKRACRSGHAGHRRDPGRPTLVRHRDQQVRRPQRDLRESLDRAGLRPDDRPPEAPADPAITFLSDGVHNAVASASAAAEGRSVGIFGASIARQCLQAGLLDEIVVHLAPVLLGDGVRFYGGPGVARVGLEPTTVAASGQTTDLRFRVVM
jgi:dihydrofolate reductase